MRIWLNIKENIIKGNGVAISALFQSSAIVLSGCIATIGVYITSERSNNADAKKRSDDVYCGIKHIEYSKCMFLLHTFWDAYENDEEKVGQKWQSMLLEERTNEETINLNECRILTKDYIAEIEICEKDKGFTKSQSKILNSRKEDYYNIVPVFTKGFKNYQIKKFKETRSE
eukprot:NODE_882_length_3472_cov_0.436110.p1 type:complete len:172 gc:universal NODE_882_length_3472_cov_0.436110:1950-1435(-)